MIVSLGEALIDLIHSDGQEPDVRVGGSPFNVAIAMSRLGVDAGLICPMSTDPYGHRLAQKLSDNSVQQCVKESVAAPTAIAEVFTDSQGHPTYRFHRENTADRALDKRPPIDSLPTNLRAIHFGSLVLAQESDWAAWKAAIVSARAQGAFIAFDPNLRVALIDDMARYKHRLSEAIELADLIKASDEDLSLLTPGCVPEEHIQAWKGTCRTVVLTEGAKGAQIWTSNGIHVAHRDSQPCTVVDTVGAGDTFQAALLAWFWHQGSFSTHLTQKQGQDLLAFANRAAALNCTKAGCDPPTFSQLME